MMKSIFRFPIILKLIIVILFFSFGLWSGCKKQEDAREAIPADTLAIPDTATTDTTSADTLSNIETDSIPDITGTWTGTFDKRSTTLKITEQNGLEFKGVITINYREVINQSVSGSINPENFSVNMKDLLHSRFMGRYNGKLTNDGTALAGTFTMNLDNSKFNFNLNKK